MTAKISPFLDCRSCVCSALRRAGRAMTRHYQACFAGQGMRATQFTVLAALDQTGPVTISRLAALLGLERTTLTRNLRPLESKGWVRTLAEAKDQRTREVELTPKGRAAAVSALPAWRRAQASAGPVLSQFGILLNKPNEK
jgi:DNA-binding MarR family transcriptional regulator